MIGHDWPEPLGERLQILWFHHFPCENCWICCQLPMFRRCWDGCTASRVWCTSAPGSSLAEITPADLLSGYGSIPMKIPFLGGWTSINPSYFDVNYRGTRFWHTARFEHRNFLAPSKLLFEMGKSENQPDESLVFQDHLAESCRKQCGYVWKLR